MFETLSIVFVQLLTFGLIACSQLEAQRLVDLAVKSLAPYGDKAKSLLGIADYIIARKNGAK
jgi:hypothetical protein